MEPVVYLIRSPVEAISPYLYSQTNTATVISLEKAPLAGRVLKSGPGCPLEEGIVLSQGELLELLLKSQRVIAL